MSEAAQTANRVRPLTIIFGWLLFMAVIGLPTYLRYSHQILAAILTFRHWELSVIGLFTDRYRDLDAAIQNPDWSTVGIASVARLGTIVGQAYNLPGAALLGILAAMTFIFAPSARFKATMKDLDALMLAMDDRFRLARSFIGRKREVRNPAPGRRPRPGDMSLSPAEWVMAYATDETGRYHDDLAWDAFVNQLGPRWDGPCAAAPHVRCLFAAFALHACRRREEAITYMGDLATSLGPGNGETPLSLPASVIRTADEILADPDVTRPCSNVAQRHFYTATAMMGVLLFAREQAGVLAPGQFNWLKLVDRSLWYALVMPPNPFSEGAGAYAHFLAEQSAHAALVVPQVKPAMRSIRAHRPQNASVAKRRR